MWPDKPINYIILPNDEEGIHLGHYVNDALVSVVSLFINNKEAQFRKLATANLEQGKGYGGRLLSHLITYVEGEKVNKIWCNARVEKIDFYLKFGFKSSNTVFTKHEIDYVVMEKMIIR